MGNDSAAAPPVPQNGTGVHDVHLKTIDTLPKLTVDVLMEVHRSFARSLRSALSELLECDVAVGQPTFGQVTYGRYLAGIEPPVMASVAAAELLDDNCMIVASHELVSSLIDRLLGGRGHPTVDRWPTDVDVAVFAQVETLILAALGSAFRPLAPATFEKERTETSPHFLGLTTHGTAVIGFDLEINLETVDIGTISVCYPLTSLRSLIEMLPGGDVAVPDDDDLVERVDLSEAPVRLELTLNKTRIPIGDFMSLRIGDVVLLDHWADQPALGMIGNQLLLEAEVGQQNGLLAALISDWRQA